MKFKACNIPNSMTISEYTKVLRYNDDDYYKNPKITRRLLQPKTKQKSKYVSTSNKLTETWNTKEV